MNTGMSRRHLLQSAAAGFGYMAWAGLAAGANESPLAPRAGHHPARAKRIIFLFMHGGPSQIDTFDYKPRIQQDDGKEMPRTAVDRAFVVSDRNHAKHIIMRSPWKFAKHGECGAWVSDLFPEMAKHVDEMCILRGMHTEGQSHGQAVLQLHTGTQNLTRPSMGSWIMYGLGSENQNLPGFITICPPRNHGGVMNYGNAFLPATYQGTAIGNAATPAARAQIAHISNNRYSSIQQRAQLDFIQQMNRDHLTRARGDDRIDGVIEAYELAFRMQSAVPRLIDLTAESKSTLALYGIDEKGTDDFGRQCLLARRFAEAGVRFIQVSHSFKWDQHGNLKGGHEKNAQEVDKPIAGLLTDLAARGLLKDTLVLWGGEFGRTPFAQGKDGRDHNPQGFTMWLAGAGVRDGFTFGETDDFGHRAVTGKVHMHDLHATLLWMLGLDHEKLTYRFAGRDFRLTDIYGRVVKEILT